MIKIAIPGSGGRMGGMLIRAIATAPDLELVAATDLPDSPFIGHDAGEVGEEDVPQRNFELRKRILSVLQQTSLSFLGGEAILTGVELRVLEDLLFILLLVVRLAPTCPDLPSSDANSL